MKKSELRSAVKDAVAKNGVELDKNVLAVQLMQAGASLSMVNRELNSALKANGVSVVTNTGSEELKKVREHVKKVLSGSKAKGKEGDAKHVPAVAPKVIASYKNLREWAEDLEDDFALTETAAIKVIKEGLKSLKLDIPSKVKLGVQKEAILNYFLESKSKPTSLKALAAYIEENALNDDGDKLDSEKALHLARMNYTFANMLYSHTSLDSVN